MRRASGAVDLAGTERVGLWMQGVATTEAIMRSSSRGLVVVLMAVLMAVLAGLGGAAWAADKAQENAVVALATARAKAELAVRNARTLADQDRSGWTAAWQAADLTRQKTSGILERRMHAEARKDEGNRDGDLMQQLQDKMGRFQEDWQAYDIKERAPLMTTYREAAETIGRLNQVLESLSNTERAWKEANLEPAMLQTLFEAITLKVGAARQQAEKSVAALREKQESLEADLEVANKLAGETKKP